MAGRQAKAGLCSSTAAGERWLLPEFPAGRGALRASSLGCGAAVNAIYRIAASAVFLSVVLRLVCTLCSALHFGEGLSLAM